MFLWEYRGTGSGNNFERKPRDNWTVNWWKPAEKRRTNCCEVNWTGVHRQMINSVCHFDRTRIDKWTILTVSVETKPGEESVEVMCFLSLIDCLQRGTLSTKSGQEPTTGKRSGSFYLSSAWWRLGGADSTCDIHIDQIQTTKPLKAHWYFGILAYPPAPNFQKRSKSSRNAHFCWKFKFL